MARFKISPEDIAELLNSDGLIADLVPRGEAVMAMAVATAPVHSGVYKASFSLRTGKHGGMHHDRGYVEVTNSADNALLVEVVNRSFTLTKALDAAGGREAHGVRARPQGPY